MPEPYRSHDWALVPAKPGLQGWILMNEWIFIYFLCNKNVRLTSVVSSMVHSIKTPDLGLSVILSALSQLVCTLMWVNLTIQLLSSICSPSSGRLIMSNFSSIPVVFHWFFPLDCTRLGIFWFVTQFGNKSQCCWRGNYIRHMIISPK